MAKIVDPDQLNDATEIVISTAAKTIQLIATGNLSNASPAQTSGVTLQAVYSKVKELWKSSGTYNKHRFPFEAIYEAKFELINSWDWADATTRQLVRDGGWREVLNNDEYAMVISLGDVNLDAHQPYHQQVVGYDQSTTDFGHTGELNEGLLIYDGTNDYRDFLKAFLRVGGTPGTAMLYSQYSLLVEQSLSAITYEAYRLPLSNAPDINISETDANIDANPPYTSMTIDYLKGNTYDTWADSVVYAAGAVVLDAILQSGGSSNGTWWFTPGGGTSSGTGTADDTGVTDWESCAGEQQIGTEWFAFNRLIDGNAATKEEIYEFAMRQLRQTGDINDDGTGTPNQDAYGTVNGNVAQPLAEFVGSTLKSVGGVAILNFDVNDTNDIVQRDITVDSGGLDSDDLPVISTEREFPFVSAGNMVFNAALTDEADVDTLFRMYFEYLQRDTSTSIAITGASGNQGTLDTTGGPDMTHIDIGDYFLMSGWATADNNGVATADANFTATGGAFTMTDTGRTVVNETVGPSVTIDWTPFDSDGAIVVNDESGPSAIEGQIDATSIAFDFDYDNNVQGGRTTATDAAVVVVAQALDGAKWVEGAFTITRTTGLNFPVNAGDERVYLNP